MTNKRAFRLLDTSFLKHPKRYILQSLLAVAAVTVILYFMDVLTHAAIVAALGSSAFIVFAMPNSAAAQPRRLIGGHVTGLLIGLMCYLVFFTGPLREVFGTTGPVHWIPPASSVGLSIFLMTIFNFEHPPAAGTALGIVTGTWSPLTFVFVLVFAASLSLIGFLLRDRLQDLST